jgi:isopentenyl phosphate kinase
MAAQLLTLLKLGGSIITDKAVQNTVRFEVLTDLIQQIEQAKKFWSQQADTADQQLIVAHGQGSFAHFPAAQYETTQGLIHTDSVYGMAQVLAAVGALNKIVVDACLAEQLSAVPWLSAQAIITKQKQAQKVWLEVLLAYLDRGLLPITTGDVVVDEAQGCAVWSGETILNYLAKTLPQHNKKVTRVIQVGEVAGVLDGSGAVIPKITPASWSAHQAAVTSMTTGTDVTGGMLKKVEESLELAITTGIETWIIDGRAHNNLYHALVGKKWLGTLMTV